MNNSSHTLLTFASWEDRFSLGFKANLNAYSCSQTLVFYLANYADKTEGARSSVKGVCRQKNIQYSEVGLSPDLPAKNLEKLSEVIGSLDPDNPIVIDISTMPREIIWHVFWLCQGRSTPFEYCYHSPESYPGNWLSRNFGRPRLIHKMSGIASSGWSTALLLVAGYDVQRVWQLVRFFEPSKLMIGLQKDSRFDNNARIMQRYAKEFPVTEGYSTFEMNAFAQDHGLDCIQQQLKDLGGEHNVILGSLGPKLTAVALYRIQRQRQDIGLVYAPASEFNENYSTGIGVSYQGTLGN